MQWPVWHKPPFARCGLPQIPPTVVGHVWNKTVTRQLLQLQQEVQEIFAGIWHIYCKWQPVLGARSCEHRRPEYSLHQLRQQITNSKYQSSIAESWWWICDHFLSRYLLYFLCALNCASLFPSFKARGYSMERGANKENWPFPSYLTPQSTHPPTMTMLCHSQELLPVSRVWRAWMNLHVSFIFKWHPTVGSAHPPPSDSLLVSSTVGAPSEEKTSATFSSSWRPPSH